MSASLRRQPAIDASVAEQFAPFPFSCGNCGQTFASKGAKLRHKRTCGKPAEVAFASVPDAEYTPPEDCYVDMRRYNTPRIRALANAEWDAMDAEGRLPDWWPARRAEIEAEWARKQKDERHG